MKKNPVGFCMRKRAATFVKRQETKEKWQSPQFLYLLAKLPKAYLEPEAGSHPRCLIIISAFAKYVCSAIDKQRDDR